MATIDELEQQAGIGSSVAERTAFWLRFHHLEGKACLDAGVAELKRMIAERDGTALRAARPRRQRWPPLNDDQDAALQDYAVRHGRRWKSVLGDVWMGGPPHDDGGSCVGFETPTARPGFNPIGCPRQTWGADRTGAQRYRVSASAKSRSSRAGRSHIPFKVPSWHRDGLSFGFAAV